MHGNVLEWCMDYWHDSYAADEQRDPMGPPDGTSRVIRGGSWNYPAGDCRSAYRHRRQSSYRNFLLGFRLAAGHVSQAILAERGQGTGEQGGASGRLRSDEGRGAQAADGERAGFGQGWEGKGREPKRSKGQE